MPKGGIRGCANSLNAGIQALSNETVKPYLKSGRNSFLEVEDSAPRIDTLGQLTLTEEVVHGAGTAIPSGIVIDDDEPPHRDSIITRLQAGECGIIPISIKTEESDRLGKFKVFE